MFGDGFEVIIDILKDHVAIEERWSTTAMGV